MQDASYAFDQERIAEADASAAGSTSAAAVEVGESVRVLWPERGLATLVAREGNLLRVLCSPRGRIGHPTEWLVPSDQVLSRGRRS
ncbi:MAG: hypothetical protein ACHQ0J_13510 [Candidatus Dormibacterales bacterium]